MSNDEEIEIGVLVTNVNESTDEKTYSVIVTEKEEPNFIDCFPVFEAKFENSNDADAFFELMKKATITI
jgi:hypothetical protein